MRLFTHAGHASEESLELHALGDLPAKRENRVEAHLSRCGVCRHRYRDIAGFIAMLRAMATIEPGHGSRAR